MIRVNRDAFGDLVAEVNRVQEEFARLFNGAAETGVAVNVWAEEDAFHLEADLPDLDPASLDVQLTEGTRLTVAGERKAPQVANSVWVRQERPSGPFSRTLVLPALVDADQVVAKYEYGVLRLTLPKSEAAKPRKITVNG
jgi:HSP20 family protein